MPKYALLYKNLSDLRFEQKMAFCEVGQLDLCKLITQTVKLKHRVSFCKVGVPCHVSGLYWSGPITDVGPTSLQYITLNNYLKIDTKGGIQKNPVYLRILPS